MTNLGICYTPLYELYILSCKKGKEKEGRQNFLSLLSKNSPVGEDIMSVTRYRDFFKCS